jgi:DNA topoisomerase-1
VGTFEDKDIDANIGRFGPYLRHEGKFYSLPKEEDPMTVELEKAIEIIEQKRKDDAARHIKSFEEDESFQILNGKWGPYLKVGKSNYKLPKDKEPESLTYQECKEIVETAPPKGKKGFRKKKS